MTDTQYKTDYVFAWLGLLSWGLSVIFVFVGIWSDGRWFWTALAVFLFGCLLLWVSAKLDEYYARMKRLK